MRYWNEYPYFKRSVPREAKGGIKAQSKRGTFGESWWARRWIMVLESFDIGARLGRGRSYARRGQVLSVEIDLWMDTELTYKIEPLKEHGVGNVNMDQRHWSLLPSHFRISPMAG